jgi:hypothetical protein
VIALPTMSDDGKKLRTEQAEGDERTVTLTGGRTLTVTPEATGDIVELRNPSGLLELRVRLTEEGPVLQVEGVKVTLKAAESVSVECKTFDVKATEGMKLQTDGELNVTSEKEMKITSTDDVRVVGKIIHLN